MQAGHDLPRDLRDECLLGIAGLLVGTAQADKALLDLHLFGFIPLHLHLIGKVQRDGVCPDVDGAGIHPARFKKEQVAAPGTNVEQHDAALGVTVVEAIGIAQGSRGHVHQMQVQIRLLAHPEKAFNDVVFDGDQ